MDDEILMAPKKFSEKYYILLDRAIIDLLKLFNLKQNQLINRLEGKTILEDK